MGRRGNTLLAPVRGYKSRSSGGGRPAYQPPDVSVIPPEVLKQVAEKIKPYEQALMNYGGNAQGLWHQVLQDLSSTYGARSGDTPLRGPRIVNPLVKPRKQPKIDLQGIVSKYKGQAQQAFHAWSKKHTARRMADFDKTHPGATPEELKAYGHKLGEEMNQLAAKSGLESIYNPQDQAKAGRQAAYSRAQREQAAKTLKSLGKDFDAKFWEQADIPGMIENGTLSREELVNNLSGLQSLATLGRIDSTALPKNLNPKSWQGPLTAAERDRNNSTTFSYDSEGKLIPPLDVRHAYNDSSPELIDAQSKYYEQADIARKQWQNQLRQQNPGMENTDPRLYPKGLNLTFTRPSLNVPGRAAGYNFIGSSEYQPPAAEPEQRQTPITALPSPPQPSAQQTNYVLPRIPQGVGRYNFTPGSNNGGLPNFGSRGYGVGASQGPPSGLRPVSTVVPPRRSQRALRASYQKPVKMLAKGGKIDKGQAAIVGEGGSPEIVSYKKNGEVQVTPTNMDLNNVFGNLVTQETQMIPGAGLKTGTSSRFGGPVHWNNNIPMVPHTVEKGPTLKQLGQLTWQDIENQQKALDELKQNQANALGIDVAGLGSIGMARNRMATRFGDFPETVAGDRDSSLGALASGIAEARGLPSRVAQSGKNAIRDFQGASFRTGNNIRRLTSDTEAAGRAAIGDITQRADKAMEDARSRMQVGVQTLRDLRESDLNSYMDATVATVKNARIALDAEYRQAKEQLIAAKGGQVSSAELAQLDLDYNSKLSQLGGQIMTHVNDQMAALRSSYTQMESVAQQNFASLVSSVDNAQNSVVASLAGQNLAVRGQLTSAEVAAQVSRLNMFGQLEGQVAQNVSYAEAKRAELVAASSQAMTQVYNNSTRWKWAQEELENNSDLTLTQLELAGYREVADAIRNKNVNYVPLSPYYAQLMNIYSEQKIRDRLDQQYNQAGMGTVIRAPQNPFEQSTPGFRHPPRVPHQAAPATVVPQYAPRVHYRTALPALSPNSTGHSLDSSSFLNEALMKGRK